MARRSVGSESARTAPARPATSGAAPRVVTLDIETAPMESYHWGLWDQNIGLEQINVDWSILAFSAKWLNEKGVHYEDTGGRGKRRVRDDRAIALSLWRILDRADIVITQNGVAFDVKKINSRMLAHGLGPYSPIKVVDTMLIAKRHFSFSSNKLKWMSQILTDTTKDDHKQFPGFELWAECLKDNPKAWAEMRKYNCRDVEATEKVYLRLRPWMVGHPNMASYSAQEEVACPKCGSFDVQMRGRSLTQSGEYHRFQCKHCGGWARSRYTLNTIEKRHALLSN